MQKMHPKFENHESVSIIFVYLHFRFKCRKYLSSTEGAFAGFEQCNAVKSIFRD